MNGGYLGMSYHVLVVDNDPLQCRSAQLTIEKMLFYKVSTLTSGQDAIDFLTSDKGKEIDLLLLDLAMPGVDGMEVLKNIKPVRQELPVIIYTAHGDVDVAVKALKDGATDFVEKKDGPERLQVSIENVLRMKKLEGEVSRLRRSKEGQVIFSDIIGDSEAIRETKELATRAASSNIPILIRGASGVGKELFARAIHGNSERAGGPFIAVNCGAIPENLVESVLFGHEKGAFTGAVDKTIGKFREANGGTLFLDEVGELKMDIQVKLLRALQEGEVEPVGASKSEKVDIRLISATNRNLKDEVDSGNFREDLYYRLNVFPLMVPSLKERKEDIAPLLEYFTETIAIDEGKKLHGLTDKAIEMLSRFDWPGNVRQLENAVYRAVVLCDDDRLDVRDFAHVITPQNKEAVAELISEEDLQPVGSSDGQATAQETPFSMGLLNPSNQFKSLADVESDVIRQALEYYNWHISQVAKKLKIGRSTLYRKMAEYNIKEPGQKKSEMVAAARANDDSSSASMG